MIRPRQIARLALAALVTWATGSVYAGLLAWALMIMAEAFYRDDSR